MFYQMKKNKFMMILFSITKLYQKTFTIGNQQEVKQANGIKKAVKILIFQYFFYL